MPLVAAALAWFADQALARDAGASLVACHLQGLERAARCGSISVEEDRARPEGRRLAIGVVVIPATVAPSLPDPIVVLTGGPGEDAIGAASLYTTRLEPLLRRRDLVLIDQRGTGRSEPLTCALYSDHDLASALREMFPEAKVSACAERLQAQADLTQYTYAAFAQDLEEIRQALGYRALNVFAGSYGTRAAQVFMRAHPDSVRTAYLGSVVPIDLSVPLTFAKNTDAALGSTLEACARDARCRAGFPHLREELARILAELAAGKVSVRVPGAAEPITLVRGRVVEWLRSRLYRPGTAAAVPYAIHRASVGDWQPIVEGILSSARALDTALSLGIFFSVTCSEDLASVSASEIQRASANTALGDYRARQQWNACQHWPRASLAPGYRTQVRSSIPTLFVSGDIDAASPPWLMRHVAEGFSNKIELLNAGHGHTEWSDCVARVYERMVRAGGVESLHSGSCPRVPRPPFKTS